MNHLYMENSVFAASESAVIHRISHLFDEVKELEVRSKDHRICNALRDAGQIVRSRILAWAEERDLRLEKYSEADEVKFNHDEYNRH